LTGSNGVALAAGAGRAMVTVGGAVGVMMAWLAGDVAATVGTSGSSVRLSTAVGGGVGCTAAGVGQGSGAGPARQAASNGNSSRASSQAHRNGRGREGWR
jgi:hypothetical protein